MKSFKQFLLEQNETNSTTPENDYHKRFHENLQKEFGAEYPIIMKGFARNNISATDYDNLALGFAIRRGEGGGPTRQFGVLHPKAIGQPGEPPDVVLERQAAWAASTIMKNRQRYKDAGETGDFITYLGNIYAPTKGNVTNDPTKLNKNWIGNVGKFHKQFIECTGPNCSKPQKETPKTETPKTPEKSKETEPTTPPDMSSPVIPPLLDEPPKKKKKS